MKIVFMGTPEFACRSLEVLAGSRHKVLAVVTGPDKPAGRGHNLMACKAKLAAQSLDIPVYQPTRLSEDSFVESMAVLHPDVFVVIAFRILPEKLFTLPAGGSINIHASLLPKYRGAAPIQHALLNGDTETGLTSFFLVREIDKGSIIDQVRTPISPDENYTSLSERLSTMAGTFLLETLELISRPGFRPADQDNSLATPAPKIRPEDTLIDWHRSCHRIHNQIRAYSERPGAYTFLEGQKMKILRSAVGEFPRSASLAPGQIRLENKHLLVGTGDFPLCLVSLQPEGKKNMDATAFANGYCTREKSIFNCVKGRD